ncbi:Methyltransferase domain [Dehalogenimonas alkenigignens]|uniref:Methyltransferase domain n=1 Tax=Dehalogenimonas alkenigignens TaxID=1217799 RepID=A0A0W0GJ26_9CHLR|nr:class I SAM-dependent methyltransferase [Dehalogenimonas alkenigignens]KTB48576.1 Methyltransferase domain [Dehalogenimonas alkenigignens]
MSNNIYSPTFDKIAAGWYGSRHHTIFKTELDELACRWQGGRLINIGCGHGADFLPFRDLFELFGIDESSEMLKFAAKYAKKYSFKAELKQADMRALPYPEAYFDNAIAVASLHHIEGREEQLRALREIRRVMKPEAEAFITVWNACQPRFWLRRRDTYIPWRSGFEIAQRFYHLFTYGEIEKLVKSAGFIIIKSGPEARYGLPVKHFSRNICLVIKRAD